MMPQAGEQYRHYKSTGGNDYTYEVIGLALHTETEEQLVLYKPLYVSDSNIEVFARPLSMRDEIVEGDDILVRRFTLI